MPSAEPEGPRLVLIDTRSQSLRVLSQGREVFACRVSTALAGPGCREGSGCTPWGWHRISSVLGDGAEPGARFVSREFTGWVWSGESSEDDLILTRILWLEGLEPGVNKGPGIDSHDRYIYIHGTNREDLLGVPASHGCVRVSNENAVRLADLVGENDAVFIGPRGDSP